MRKYSSRANTSLGSRSLKLDLFSVEWKKGEDPKLLQTGKLPSGSRATALALSPTGNVVAVACDGALLTYFADTAELDNEIHDIYSGKQTQRQQQQTQAHTEAIVC